LEVDFDDVLATVAFFLRFNPKARFITSYYHRRLVLVQFFLVLQQSYEIADRSGTSGNRSISWLLKKWKLKASAIDMSQEVACRVAELIGGSSVEIIEITTQP